MGEADGGLFLRAARGERTRRTPVWLMRQAGRFDPAYRALRGRCGLPLEAMFRAPELAAEITLLPRRFGVDALILFQDILTPLAPMGAPFVFRPGPVLERPLRSGRDLQRLGAIDPAEALPFIAESIALVRGELGGALPLLGFAGAPFTLAAFMIEGRSPGPDLAAVRGLMRSDPSALHHLLERLAVMTAAYLRLQIEHGVAAVQLFESVGDRLSAAEYRAFAHPYQAQVFAQVGMTVPRILFTGPGTGLELMMETGAEVLSVGSRVDLAAARRRLGRAAALQGNVDHRLLAGGPRSEIEAAVRDCIAAGGHHGHILNLDGGLRPETPVEHVQALIEVCRGPVTACGDGG